MYPHLRTLKFESNRSFRLSIRSDRNNLTGLIVQHPPPLSKRNRCPIPIFGRRLAHFRSVTVGRRWSAREERDGKVRRCAQAGRPIGPASRCPRRLVEQVLPRGWAHQRRAQEVIKYHHSTWFHSFTFTQRVKLDLIMIDQMSIGTIGSISKGANEEKVICKRLYH